MTNEFLNHLLIEGDDIDQAWENAIARENEFRAKGDTIDVLEIRVKDPEEGLAFPQKAPQIPRAEHESLMMDIQSAEKLATFNKEYIDWSQRLHDPYTILNDEKISLNFPNPVGQMALKYEKGHGQNQVIYQVSMPSDNGIGRERPNLVFIDTRIRYGKLHLFSHYVNTDLAKELPYNMLGMHKIQKKLADMIGVAPGELYFTCLNHSLEDEIKAEYQEPEFQTDMNPFKADVFNLDELWFTMLLNCLEKGYKYPVEHGSFAKVDTRMEFDYTTFRVKNPGNRPLAPIIPEGWSGFTPPTTVNKIEEYFQTYLQKDTKEKNEDYSYARRILDPHIPIEFKDEEERKENIPWIKTEVPTGINQYIAAFERFSNGEKFAITEIGRGNDIVLQSPPCARVQYFMEKNGKLHSMLYFRSWDLYSGLPQNLGGFELMKEDLAEGVGLENGEMLASSKGLHIYGNSEELAEMRTYKKKFEAKKEE